MDKASVRMAATMLARLEELQSVLEALEQSNPKGVPALGCRINARTNTWITFPSNVALDSLPRLKEAINEYQLAHMRSLAEILPEEKCWCGWERFGKCNNKPPLCYEGFTCADKLAASCNECEATPCSPDDNTIHHRITCSKM